MLHGDICGPINPIFEPLQYSFYFDWSIKQIITCLTIINKNFCIFQFTFNVDPLQGSFPSLSNQNTTYGECSKILIEIFWRLLHYDGNWLNLLCFIQTCSKWTSRSIYQTDLVYYETITCSHKFFCIYVRTCNSVTCCNSHLTLSFIFGNCFFSRTSFWLHFQCIKSKSLWLSYMGFNPKISMSHHWSSLTKRHLYWIWFSKYYLLHQSIN